MSLHEPVDWIVAYDIHGSRDRARVFKLLKSHGIPLQYSVFQVRGTQAMLCALMHRLSGLIRGATDDVRAYRVPVDTQWVQLGQTKLPQGVLPGHDCASPDRRPVAWQRANPVAPRATER